MHLAQGTLSFLLVRRSKTAAQPPDIEQEIPARHGENRRIDPPPPPTGKQRYVKHEPHRRHQGQAEGLVGKVGGQIQPAKGREGTGTAAGRTRDMEQVPEGAPDIQQPDEQDTEAYGRDPPYVRPEPGRQVKLHGGKSPAAITA